MGGPAHAVGDNDMHHEPNTATQIISLVNRLLGECITRGSWSSAQDLAELLLVLSEVAEHTTKRLTALSRLEPEKARLEMRLADARMNTAHTLAQA